jgi:hypothetical protein
LFSVPLSFPNVSGPGDVFSAFSAFDLISLLIKNIYLYGRKFMAGVAVPLNR